MVEQLRPSDIPKEKQKAARDIYNELWLHQGSNIRTCLGPEPGTGAVFFPIVGDKIYSVEIARHYPFEPGRSPFAEVQSVVQQQLQMKKSDTQLGFTHIKEGFVETPTSIYEGYGDQKTEIQYWTQPGIVYQSNASGSEWERGKLSVLAKSAVDKFNLLRKIPSRIKNTFDTYDDLLKARESLGEVDTNGIDHYDPVEIDGGKEPWNLFRREGALAQLVEEAPPLYTY